MRAQLQRRVIPVMEEQAVEFRVSKFALQNWPFLTRRQMIVVMCTRPLKSWLAGKFVAIEELVLRGSMKLGAYVSVSSAHPSLWTPAVTLQAAWAVQVQVTKDSVACCCASALLRRPRLCWLTWLIKLPQALLPSKLPRNPV